MFRDHFIKLNGWRSRPSNPRQIVLGYDPKIQNNINIFYLFIYRPIY